MVSCDNCKNEVAQVWRYRRPTETMTFWREEQRCAGCHPRMDERRGRSSA
ncbi:hypothetical protein NDI56_13730 [Haloarcula sp. S1CR25-12]|uniref:Small CPxCG-related zinc finger protein n=1 Tax=Haloarcula saliterrae TaxID=2950534 RepID=A0ABU2FDX2_9EURY|nr:hypothetical protein [Haloarcula sp. S1CR25-12]MDS0260460.1 hypothetical protein [Haloarcula sp. S1CR25-12]